MTNGLSIYDPDMFLGFIGWARTGHSLVGSLLDAHPNVIVSNEIHAFDRFKKINKDELFKEIHDNSKFKAENGRLASDYIYSQYVDNGWQGTSDDLKVIGDKKGGGTLLQFRDNKNIVEDFKDYISIPLRFICVLRNPMDSIATSLVRRPNSFENRHKQYLRNFKLLDEFLKNHKDITYIVRFEDFILNFYDTFTLMLYFLNLEPHKDYIDKCSEIVFNEIPFSRNKIEWDYESINKINNLVNRFDFLKSYRGEICR